MTDRPAPEIRHGLRYTYKDRFGRTITLETDHGDEQPRPSGHGKMAPQVRHIWIDGLDNGERQAAHDETDTELYPHIIADLVSIIRRRFP